MPLLPDSLRQQLAPVVKHHFWILAALVPLLLVPALFMAGGQLRGQIASERAKIDGHVSALNGVQTEPDHPNDAWSEAVAGQTAAVRKDLLAEWTAFWEGQRPLRVWPQDLGPDFLEAINAVASGNRRDLQFRDLQRYQNTVPDIVRSLPGRMGCEELMAGPDGELRGELPGAGRRLPRIGLGLPGEGEDDDPEASLSRAPLIWKTEDQQRLFKSFAWERPPSTTQVLLAQEELWVYGLFCDAIRKLNQGAKGAFDSSVTMVEELAVGYPAAEEKPGGQGAGRVYGVREPVAGAGGAGGFEEGLPPPEAGLDEMGRGGGFPEGRPPHPRFSPASGGLEGMEFGGGGPQRPPGGGLPGAGEGDGEIDGEPTLSPDDQFKQWIYVDFTGRPLTATELATAPDAQLVHLMPFALRVVMDQRQLDRLLTELAASRVPIDVRQVRINPATQTGGESLLGRGGMAGGPAGRFGSPDGSPADARRRPFDVTVELRGTVGLATPPSEAVLGGQTGQSEPAADGGA